MAENRTMPERYRNPPKRAFRAMKLGVLEDGFIRVVAGFKFKWWCPGSGVEPIIVKARVLRLKAGKI